MKMKSIKVMFAGLLIVPMLAFSVSLFAPMSAFASSLQDGANAAKGDNTTTCMFTKTDVNKKLDNGQPNPKYCASGVFTTIANVALFIIGAISVLMLIYGGIRYTASGGNEKNVTAAKNTIIYAIVGIIVAIMAYAIVNFVIGAFA